MGGLARDPKIPSVMHTIQQGVGVSGVHPEQDTAKLEMGSRVAGSARHLPSGTPVQGAGSFTLVVVDLFG